MSGTDQLFNLLVGRNLQHDDGQAPQIVLTTPLLVGLDGVQKMSKSLGNYVGVAEPPAEQFGKLMSIPDAALPMYLQYATGWPPEVVTHTVEELGSGTLHPNAAKRLMARAVVDLYHGAGAGDAAEVEFDKVFKAHEAPTEMDEHRVAAGTQLSDALLAAGLVPSKREARRAIEQGSVRVDGEKCTADAPLTALELVVQVGKRRWARIFAA